MKGENRDVEREREMYKEILYCVLYYFCIVIVLSFSFVESVNNVNNVNNEHNFIYIWVQEHGNLGRRLFTCSIKSSHDSVTE